MISENLRTFKFLAIALIAFLLPTVIARSCACEKTIPNTSYQKTVPVDDKSQVVRPNHRVYRPNAPLKLPEPMGDSCWCSKLLVQPAKVPHTTPDSSKPPVKKCSCSPRPSKPPAPYSGSKCPKSGTSGNSIPADPVSQSLAIQANKAVNVPEAKLAFGFVSTPINSLRKNFIFTEVPEEDLFKMNNRIIALKMSRSPQEASKEMDKNDYLAKKGSNSEIEEERKCQLERRRQQKEQLGYKVEGEYQRGQIREQERTQEYERQQEPERKSECEAEKERTYKRVQEQQNEQEYSNVAIEKEHKEREYERVQEQQNEEGYGHVAIEKQEKERVYEHLQEVGRTMKCDHERELSQHGREREQQKQQPEMKLHQVYKEEPPRSLQPPCPSYEMIGFTPENFQDPKFKKLRPCVSNTNNKLLTSYKPRGKNCGCKQGQRTHDTYEYNR